MTETMVGNALSDPGQMRLFLADFYQKRIYHLQHKKYKMLTRWAHFALTSESIDRISSSGTFDYGRIEYEIENAIKRHDRLVQKDGYEEVRDGSMKRPRQTEEDNETAYEQAQKREDNIQDRTTDPVSCIRLDDFEVLLRVQTYQNKIIRPMQKFLAKAKWVSTTKSIEIYS